MNGTQQMIVIALGELLAFMAAVMIFGDKRPRR